MRAGGRFPDALHQQREDFATRHVDFLARPIYALDFNYNAAIRVRSARATPDICATQALKKELPLPVD